MMDVLLVLLVIAVLFLWAWFFAPNIICGVLIRLSRFVSGYKAKKIIVDGYEWHYLISGEDDKDKEVVVLLHGFGANKDLWLPFSRFFNNKYRVIIPDLPGFGDNKKDPSITYTMEEQADRLSSFIKLLRVEKIHLTGNSMGGYISTYMALKHPEQLASVVLMNSAGVKGENQSWLEEQIDKGINPLVVKSIDDMDGLFSKISHKPMVMPGVMKRFIFNDMHINHDFYDSIFWSFFSSTGEVAYLNDELEKISTPLLILWGVHDQILDVSCAHLIKEKLPSAELVILDEVGHVPMMEAAKVSAKHQLSFLSKL